MDRHVDLWAGVVLRGHRWIGRCVAVDKGRQVFAMTGLSGCVVSGVCGAFAGVRTALRRKRYRIMTKLPPCCDHHCVLGRRENSK